MNLYVVVYNQANPFILGGIVGFIANDKRQLKELLMNEYYNGIKEARWEEENIDAAISGCLVYPLRDTEGRDRVPEMEFEFLYDNPETMSLIRDCLAALV